MKVSKIEWAKCPHCNVVHNGYQFYPANAIMTGESYLGTPHKCDRCGKKVYVFCSVNVKFEMEKSDDET
jgi:hypothetical protein